MAELFQGVFFLSGLPLEGHSPGLRAGEQPVWGLTGAVIEMVDKTALFGVLGGWAIVQGMPEIVFSPQSRSVFAKKNHFFRHFFRPFSCGFCIEGVGYKSFISLSTTLLSETVPQCPPKSHFTTACLPLSLSSVCSFLAFFLVCCCLCSRSPPNNNEHEKITV